VLRDRVVGTYANPKQKHLQECQAASRKTHASKKHSSVLVFYSALDKFNRGDDASNQKQDLRNSLAKEVDVGAPAGLGNQIVVLCERI